MQTAESLAIVRAWVEAANAQDAERLIALSDPHIEVGGPRGSGFGHALLRDWLARAGLSLTTLRTFARGGTVVAEQRGVWHAPESANVVGEQTVASVFVVDGRRVVRFARYDTLRAALAAAGLDQADEVRLAG
ncbi:MAG TPA: nuclear transport factor 2 family protein [Ktedonobacterales bacterium]